MSRAFNLFRLQQVDTQIDRVNARLSEIEKMLLEDAEIQAAKKSLSRAEEQQDAARGSLSSAENNSRDQRLKIEQTENHLYSGKVHNPKELQDQQNEVAALKRYLAILEDRQLESMLAFEEADEALRTSRSMVDQVAARKLEGNAALLGEQTRLLAEAEHLASERSVVTISISPEDLEIYEKLRKKRRGIAVAEAAGRSCSACGTSLSAALYQAARSPSTLAFCDTCKRVLYTG